MNADSFFTIGNGHIICQDYALHGIYDNIPYIIVADGCSASSMVDIGARVLVLAAQEALINIFTGNDFEDVQIDSLVIDKIKDVIKLFPHLMDSFSDATLLIGWVHTGKFYGYMFGDGNIIYKTKDAMTVYNTSFSQSAPDYLSYHLNPNRKTEYINFKENVKSSVYYTRLSNPTRIVLDTFPSEIFCPTKIIIPVTIGDLVGLTTDGLSSFCKNNKSVLWYDMAEELMNFKLCQGEFVTRRINAVKRNGVKDGLGHFDDLSMGVIQI